MRVVRSLLYGYLGAILAGLLVAIVGITMGYSKELITAASVPTGVVFGAIGLSLVWWRPIAERVRLDVTQPRRNGRGHTRP